MQKNLNQRYGKVFTTYKKGSNKNTMKVQNKYKWNLNQHKENLNLIKGKLKTIQGLIKL